jgi:Fur family ferric uptake transcriptional regulator
MSAENWLKALSDNGYRLTGARRAVVDIVGASPRAMTPLEVFDSARAKYPELGLVTVYRTLEKLEELHLIQRVHDLLPHKNRGLPRSKSPAGCQAFISASQGHQHLLMCQNCGEVTFFEGDDLDNLIIAISGKTGYTIQEHWLQFYGLCANCRQEELTGGQ